MKESQNRSPAESAGKDWKLILFLAIILGMLAFAFSL